MTVVSTPRCLAQQHPGGTVRLCVRHLVKQPLDVVSMLSHAMTIHTMRVRIHNLSHAPPPPPPSFLTCVAGLGGCQDDIFTVQVVDGVIGGGHVGTLQHQLHALGGKRLGIT